MIDGRGVANGDINEWAEDEDDDEVASVSSLIFLRTKCLMYTSLCNHASMEKKNQSILIIIHEFSHNFEVMHNLPRPFFWPKK